MIAYEIGILPGAIDDISQRHRYLKQQAGQLFADTYARELQIFLNNLKFIPHVGHKRDDIIQDLRVLGYRKHATISFQVDETRKMILIVAILFGGQSLEKRFS